MAIWYNTSRDQSGIEKARKLVRGPRQTWKCGGVEAYF